MAEARDNRAATREELHRAVDLFIDRQRIKLRREDTQKLEWQTIPSLWEQLETSAMWSGAGAGGSAFGARPVISAGVVDLLILVAGATTEGALEFIGENRKNVPANLRAVAANLPDDVDLIAWWIENVRGWCKEARAQLNLDPVRPQWARGVKCPDCGADTARAEKNGETVRTPALAITWIGPNDDEHHPDTAWKVRAVECRSCDATWWRGPDLDYLVESMMKVQLAQETMALPDTA